MGRGGVGGLVVGGGDDGVSLEGLFSAVAGASQSSSVFAVSYKLFLLGFASVAC